MKKTIIFLFLCIVGFFSLRPLSISQKLASIPEKDRYVLEAFFRYILFEESFAYVLFGDKPVSLSGYFDPKEISGDNLIFIRQLLHKKNWIVKRGFEVWQKYQHLFPSSNYRLNIERSLEFDSIFHITLFSKKNVFLMFEKHSKDFKKILGSEITVEALWKECGNDHWHRTALKNHEALFGILLGYGRENACLYHRRAIVGIDTYLPPGVYFRTRPRPSPGYSSAEEEFRVLDQIAQPFCEEDYEWPNYKFMFLPHFMADQNIEETKQLKIKYRNERKQIREIYSKGDFLEITLSRFTSE